MPVRRFLTRNIVILSFVSLFTDVAGEMLYPVMPIYLREIGFSIVLIGLLEGVAEATAGLSKGFFGKWSDENGRRLPFVQLGYLLSAVSKPLMVVFSFPLWVFGARTLDRLGKGMRTSARDAMLSDETTPEHKGQVFGFHRALDTLGAAIGPLVALAYLSFFPGDYKTLFTLAFIPGVLTVALSMIIKEKKAVAAAAPIGKNKFFSYLGYWNRASAGYKTTVTALLLFTLFNSSDVFLLLLLKYKGFDDFSLLTVYIFYNLVYAVLAYPAGLMGDQYGLKNNLLIGMFLFALTYGLITLTETHWQVFGVFFLYGGYSAFIEGSSKAILTNQSDNKDTATAIGFYSSFNSILLLAASFLAGLLWQSFGPTVTFVTSAAGVMVAFILLLRSRN